MGTNIEEFGKVLDECPIRYFHSIGMEFESTTAR